MHVPHLNIGALNAREVVCVCLYVRMYVCIYVCIYVCMYVCINVCMYVCIYICMNLCMYFVVHINKHIYIYAGSMYMSIYLNMFYLPRELHAWMRSHICILVWMMILA